MREIARKLELEVDAGLERSPALVLLGPRQVGKTTLARKIAAARPGAVYLDLERPADAQRLVDADAFLRSQAGRLVVLDEIHRVPQLFATLRGVIDDRRASGDRVGHFLLLGSASLELMQQGSESLAGRVEYLELAPIIASEVDDEPLEVERLWVRGGFPDSLLAGDDDASQAWRSAFVRSYLQRDVPMFAPRIPAETLSRFWTMLAHAQGSPLNAARLAASLDVRAPTVGRYLDLLVDLLLVRRLRPWSGNVGKRLVRAPKIYVRDSGIVHALLGQRSAFDVLGHPVAGASWEGFVVESLIAAAGPLRTAMYYRTEDGAEMDLVFERGGEVEYAIEIKRSTAPTLTRGFHSARAVLRAKHTCVVHAARDRWPMGDGVEAISLRELMAELSSSR